MLKVKTLRKLAVEGLGDIRHAAKEIPNNPYGAILFEQVWGPKPWIALVGVGILSGIVGAMLEMALTNSVFSLGIHWPVVVFSVIAAWRIRTVLFGKNHIREYLDDEDNDLTFQALALPLIPGALVLLLISLIGEGLFPSAEPLFTRPDGVVSAILLVGNVFEHTLGLGAVIGIVVATLCYSRRWIRGLWKLMWRVLWFSIVLWFTELVLLTLAPWTRLTSIAVNTVMAATFPEALGTLLDGLTHLVFVSMIYLGVIGALWIVAERNFPKLLAGEDINLVKAMDERVKPNLAKKGATKKGNAEPLLLEEAHPAPIVPEELPASAENEEETVAMPHRETA